jgi:hypothetical protein
MRAGIWNIFSFAILPTECLLLLLKKCSNFKMRFYGAAIEIAGEMSTPV